MRPNWWDEKHEVKYQKLIHNLDKSEEEDKIIYEWVGQNMCCQMCLYWESNDGMRGSCNHNINFIPEQHIIVGSGGDTTYGMGCECWTLWKERDK